MTRYNRAEEKRTDPRPAYIYLGVDTEGGSHVYHTCLESVYTIEDTDVDYHESLDGRSITTYLEYVADHRGWATYRLDRTAPAPATTVPTLGKQSTLTSVTITAASRQLLTGLTIGSQCAVECQCCGQAFYEGDIVSVIVDWTTDSVEWILQRTYCPACSSTEVRDPTLGCNELLVHCRLGTLSDGASQRSKLVVLSPIVLAVSHPTESGMPAPQTAETDRDVPIRSQPRSEPGACRSSGMLSDSATRHRNLVSSDDR